MLDLPPLAFNILIGFFLMVVVALGFVRGASMDRKQWTDPDRPWQASKFEFWCAWVMSIGFLGLTWPFFELASVAWSVSSGELASYDGIGAIVMSALALAFPTIGTLSIFQLANGKWVIFP